MTAGWVAGSVRARAIARRRVGFVGVRALAGSAGLADAVESLARSPYGRSVHSGDALPDAVRGVAATLLWNLRVLAGWLPASGAETLRLLAGWFEIANVEQHCRALQGLSVEPPFPLGTLATAWSQIASAASRDELRSALAASPWGDPGGTGSRDIQLSMRMAWADRVATRVPAARAWALGAAALLLAREQLARRERLPDAGATIANRLFGPRWMAATTLGELRAALPAPARWAVGDLGDVTRLWEAEAGWWRRVRVDSTRLLSGSGFHSQKFIGAAGLMAVDAWLVMAALEIASRGGDSLEVFDALA